MASYVNNLKINNLYYKNHYNTKCKKNVDNQTNELRKLIPLDKENNPFKYDDSDFWNKYFDYNSNVNDDGSKIYYSGVCNPLLLDSCENIKEKDNVPMNGMCDTKNLNTNTFYFNIDKDMSLSNNYKTNNQNNFNITDSHKLNINQKISDSIQDKEDFARKYCKSGEFIVKDNEYFCS